jgi:hypothetical protein
MERYDMIDCLFPGASLIACESEAMKAMNRLQPARTGR